jgi:hypothetical protein
LPPAVSQAPFGTDAEQLLVCGDCFLILAERVICAGRKPQDFAVFGNGVEGYASQKHRTEQECPVRCSRC